MKKRFGFKTVSELSDNFPIKKILLQENERDESMDELQLQLGVYGYNGILISTRALTSK